jgi:Mn-dependent DtxR family transcriptional regulator
LFQEGEDVKARESEENYLETIFILGQYGGKVRSVDVANELNFTRASVSIAMKNLRVKGYIIVGRDGYIELTPSGLAIGESMYERHLALSNWLISMGVGRETALRDACKIEHFLSAESFAAIKKHIDGC